MDKLKDDKSDAIDDESIELELLLIDKIVELTTDGTAVQNGFSVMVLTIACKLLGSSFIKKVAVETSVWVLV